MANWHKKWQSITKENLNSWSQKKEQDTFQGPETRRELASTTQGRAVALKVLQELSGLLCADAGIREAASEPFLVNTFPQNSEAWNSIYYVSRFLEFRNSGIHHGGNSRSESSGRLRSRYQPGCRQPRAGPGTLASSRARCRPARLPAPPPRGPRGSGTPPPVQLRERAGDHTQLPRSVPSRLCGRGAPKLPLWPPT